MRYLFLSAAALLLIGCHGQGSSPAASGSASSSAAPAKSPASLAGLWAGEMPPSSNGSVIDVPPGGSRMFLHGVLEIAPPGTADAALSGAMTICTAQQSGETDSFSGLRVGGASVALLSNGKAIQPVLSIAEVLPDQHSVRAVLTEGTDRQAGYLKRVTPADAAKLCPGGPAAPKGSGV